MSKALQVSASLAAGVLALGLSAATAATVSFTNVTALSSTGRVAAFNDFLPNAQRIQVGLSGAATPGGNNVTVNLAAQARTAGNTITTNVGVIAGIGGTGSGTTATGNRNQIQIRSGNNGGRFNVLQSGGNFIDSNDTNGFSWTISNDSFGRIRGMSAFLTDPNDAGRRLTVTLRRDGKQLFSQNFGTALPNSTVWHMRTNFTGINWTEAVFRFDNNGTNDGIGLSNMTLHAIPLPAGVWLLLTGLGALGLVTRRRRRAAEA